jgi:hypothetical protein
MQMTNRLGLPAPIAEALSRSDEDYDGHSSDITVTGLINPPRINALRKRHRADIVEDVSEQLWRLLGTATHYMIDKSSGAAVLAEERLSVSVNGWTVSGKIDLLCQYVNDYKVTSVWAFLLGDKPEWEAQLNAYDLLLRTHGHDAPDGLRIIAILRDWKKSDYLRDPSRYPAAPIMIKEVPRWSPEEQVQWMTDRVKLHQAAAEQPDAALPMCQPEERWQSETTYAVMKEGNKRATKVCATEGEAETFIMQQAKPGQFDLVERPGACRRCAEYCDVAKFCDFGRQVLAEAEALV